jgi:hypothetical protein
MASLLFQDQKNKYEFAFSFRNSFFTGLPRDMLNFILENPKVPNRPRQPVSKMKKLHPAKDLGFSAVPLFLPRKRSQTNYFFILHEILITNSFHLVLIDFLKAFPKIHSILFQILPFYP